MYAPGAPKGCGWWGSGEEAPEPGTCAAFRLSGGREKPCWHETGCPYKKAFDPDPGESVHNVDDLARLVEFCAFCMEANEIPDPSAPPPKSGQKQRTVTRYSLSLEKFRLALELWGIEYSEHKKMALKWASDFAQSAENAKDAAMIRRRKAMLKK